MKLLNYTISVLLNKYNHIYILISSMEALKTEKESLKMELYEGTQYKDEVALLKKEKERLSDKVDKLWKELKDHQDMVSFVAIKLCILASASWMVTILFVSQNHATEKEHLDLRRELESQIREKDEELKTMKIQMQTLQKESR